MNKINAEAVVDTSSLRQKVRTSKNDPNKKFLLADDGNLIEYHPSSPIMLKVDPLLDDEDDETTSMHHMAEASQLGIIPLDNTSNFEENLINELDSSIMDAVPNSHFTIQHMDIRQPISKLRKLLEKKLNLILTDCVFFLQNTHMLQDHKNLVDQCVQGEGLVQINVEVQILAKKINIIDVLKPAKDYVHVDDEEEMITEEDDEEEEEEDRPETGRDVVQWQVDLQYKKEQDRLKIPTDPIKWNTVHVRHWLQWAVRQFNLSNIKLEDWSKITGEELYKLTMQDFQKIVPNDPGDVFWTHLELLRKMNLVAIKRQSQPITSVHPVKEYKITSKSTKTKTLPPGFSNKSHISSQNPGNKSGNNGQIQLWQFLLELLTNKEYRPIIQWTGKDAEFKLIHPEVVAHLWGERKNKPTMNYEKLSRALRYYYDGDMICKVHGKRFVYKFVCDLKQLLGYSADELSNLVKFGNPMIVNKIDK